MHWCFYGRHAKLAKSKRKKHLFQHFHKLWVDPEQLLEHQPSTAAVCLHLQSRFSFSVLVVFPFILHLQNTWLNHSPPNSYHCIPVSRGNFYWDGSCLISPTTRSLCLQMEKCKREWALHRERGLSQLSLSLSLWALSLCYLLETGGHSSNESERSRTDFFQPVRCRMLGICGVLSKECGKDAFNEIIVSTHQFPCHCSHTSSGKLSRHC